MANNNPKSMIQDIVSHASSYGFQRSNRFVVFISGPKFPQGTDYATHVKRLALTCNATTFPGRRIGTQDFTVYNVPTRMPNREIFSQELNLQFLCSTDMYEAMYFKYWQDQVMDPLTNSANFYNNYAKPFNVTIISIPNSINDYSQLAGIFLDNPEEHPNRSYVPASGLRNTDTEQSIYYRKCLECYPVEIVANEMGSVPGNTVMTINVRMAFKKWVDPIELWYKQYYETSRRAAIEFDKSSENTWEQNRIINNYTVTQTQYVEPVDPPWVRFRKFARDVVRISDPKEFRRVAVDQAADILGSTFGIENVENAAGAGQVIDVYRRNPGSGYGDLRDRLLGPITNIGLG